jgi:alpha-tubulin suppressor-like RCC1 family protein
MMAENMISDSPVMMMSAGQSHTMAINSKGKAYVWGWNDNGQCGKSPAVDEIVLNE